MSQVGLARELGVSKQAVNQGVKAGRVLLEPNGLIDLPAAIARWNTTSGGTGAENGRKHRGGQSGTGPNGANVGDVGPPGDGGGQSGPDYHLGRAVRETYMAKLARLRYEAMTGQLINAEDVERHAHDRARAAQKALLSIPSRLPLTEAQRQLVRLELLAVCEMIAGEAAPVEAEKAGARG